MSLFHKNTPDEQLWFDVLQALKRLEDPERYSPRYRNIVEKLIEEAEQYITKKKSGYEISSSNYSVISWIGKYIHTVPVQPSELYKLMKSAPLPFHKPKYIPQSSMEKTTLEKLKELIDESAEKQSQEVISNNILLVEFLGYFRKNNNTSHGNIARSKHWELPWGFFDDGNLLFHKDWNWLMAVKEKIDNLSQEITNELSFYVYTVKISYHSCKIVKNYLHTTDGETYTESEPTIIEHEDKDLITSVYLSCVQFVKEFNTYHSLNLT